MNRVHTPILIALTVLLAASACLATLPISNSEPATLLPSITLTTATKPAASTAAATLTRPNPTPVPSITTTPFPSITPLPSATATATETPIGFVPSPAPVTPTAELAPTAEEKDPSEGATDDWGSDLRCSLISKTPANWTEVPPLGKYKVSWTLLNSGRKTWQANELTLSFFDGAKLTPEKKDRLMRDVKVGQTITPVINIYPPKLPGHYRSVWALSRIKDGHVFCTFTIKIIVAK